MKKILNSSSKITLFVAGIIWASVGCLVGCFIGAKVFSGGHHMVAESKTTDAEFSKYESEMMQRSARLLLMQEQIALMLLQQRGEIPYQPMVKVEDVESNGPAPTEAE